MTQTRVALTRLQALALLALREQLGELVTASWDHQPLAKQSWLTFPAIVNVALAMDISSLAGDGYKLSPVHGHALAQLAAKLLEE